MTDVKHQQHVQRGRDIGESVPHVLILIDDAAQREHLNQLLVGGGYRVTRVAPGESLAAAVEDPAVDSVLLGPSFGELDCLEILRIIRRTRPAERLPVIALNASDSGPRCAAAYRAGATADLRLPCDDDELLAKLETQLHLTQAYVTLLNDYVRKERRHAQLEADLELGQHVQESFLPPSQLRTGNFSLEARLMAGGDLSGDYFDYALLTPERLVVFLADVSGHGVASALLANRLKAFFDENIRSAHRPRLFMDQLNRVILDLGDHYHIATAVCVHIDVTESVITYASAGHRTMYWLDIDNGKHTELPATGPALGMFEVFEINEATRSFTPGRNRLVTYTDGLVEFKLAEDRWVTEEGFRDEVMLPNANLGIELYVSTLLARSRQLTGKDKWDDDVSLLVVDF
jgi:sigma-B regulation protein RsbU (phosphoserine phosphatase)